MQRFLLLLCLIEKQLSNKRLVNPKDTTAMKNNRCISQLLAFGLFTSISFGQYTFAASKSEHLEFVVGEGSSLQIRNFGGEITVSTGSDDKIVVDYVATDDRADIVIEKRHYFIDVRVDYESMLLTDNAPINFNVQIPEGARVFINNTEGAIVASGLSGKTGMTAVSSSISLSDSSGEVAIKSVSGDISINNVDASELNVDSISGHIEFNNENFPGDAYELDNISGDITISHDIDASYFLRLITVTGSIDNQTGVKEDVFYEEGTGKEVPPFDFRNSVSRLNDKMFSGRELMMGGYNGDMYSPRIIAETISGKIILKIR